jgi:hypothetical protein
MKRRTRTYVLSAMAVSLSMASACDQILVREPRVEDLAGRYVITQESREFLKKDKGYASVPDATIELRADRTITLRDMPDCVVDDFDYAHRFLSGHGTWTLEKAFVGYGLDLIIAKGETFPEGGYSGPWVTIRRRSAPYELELTIGDPDSGQTIRLQRSAK